MTENNILDLDQIREHVRGYGGLEEVVVLRLIERIEILTAALRRVEYETGDPDTFGCPACGALEGTPHAGCCEVGNALSGVSEKTGRSKDAALNALDEIAKLCGCPHWDYPGQIVRDVTHLVAQNATLRVRAEKAEGLLEQARGMFVFNDTPPTEIEKLILGVEPDLSAVLETELLRAEVRDLTESETAAREALGEVVMRVEKTRLMAGVFGDFLEQAGRLMWPEEGDPKARHYFTVNLTNEGRRYSCTLQAEDGKTPVDLLGEKDNVLSAVREGLVGLKLHTPVPCDLPASIDRLLGLFDTPASVGSGKVIPQLLQALQDKQLEIDALLARLVTLEQGE